MQNYLARNLIYKSRGLLKNKIASFSILVKKGQMTKFDVVVKKQRLIISSQRCFSTKEEKQSEQEGTNEQETNQEEQTGEDNQANYKTSRRIRYAIGKTIKYLIIFGGFLTLWNAYLYSKKENPKEHYGYFEFFNKIVRNIHYFWFITYGTLTLPFYEKVLPDTLELVGQPPKKTLVVNLNKTLINYEYKFGKGFEILKRPGLLKFLQEMGQYYEVVIYGSEDSNFVEEIAGKLDQFDMNIKHKVGKEATRLVNRKYVKDLHFLNRDLKNVVCIDYDPDNVMFNPENVIIIPEFTGDGKDRELVQSIVFLKELAKPDVKDVRKELEKYGHYRSYINFYKSNPKYKKLLPPEETVKDDADLQAVRKSK